MPSGLGSEAAGVIEALGEGVTGFQVGDRVGYCWGQLGAYSQAVNFPADKLVKLPDDISDEVAAAGYEAAEANRPICIPGAPNIAIAALLKVLPAEWVMALMRGRRLRSLGR